MERLVIKTGEIIGEPLVARLVANGELLICAAFILGRYGPITFASAR
jgi:hypothetical protein